MILAAVLSVAVSGCAPKLIPMLQGPERDLGMISPGELTLRDELLTLPFKHVEWQYKYPNDRILRVTLGYEHLYLETPNHSLISINRHDGTTMWKYSIPTERPLDWRPVEAWGIPAEVRELEQKLRQSRRDIDDAIKEEGPGKKSEELWKRHRELKERLKVAQLGDNVYFISRGDLTCLSRRTGARLWRRRVTPWFTPSARPFAIRNYVFVPSGDKARVWQLDVEKKGEVMHFYRASIAPRGRNNIFNQPFYSNPNLYYVSHDGNIYAYDVGKRKFKWTYPTEREIKSDPLVYTFRETQKDPDGREREKRFNLVFVGGMDNTFYAVDGDTGSLHWKYEAGTPFKSRAVAKDRTVYVRSEGGALFALDVNPVHKDSEGVVTGPVRSGKLRWKLPLGRRFLVKGSQFVYVLGPNRTIYAIEEMTGKIQGRYPIQYFSFLVTNPIDDIFYAVHRSGHIFALRESKEKF